MALEDRVIQLENEVKILKNEIQHILLNIQEKLLSTTYTDLYSYQSTAETAGPPPREVAAPPPSVRANDDELTVAQKYPVQQVVLIPTEEHPADSFVPADNLVSNPAGQQAVVATERSQLEQVEHEINSVNPNPSEWTEKDELELEKHLDELLLAIENDFEQPDPTPEESRALNPALLAEMINRTLGEEKKEPTLDRSLHRSAGMLQAWIADSIKIFGKKVTIDTIRLYRSLGAIAEDLGRKVEHLIATSPVTQEENATQPTLDQVTQSLGRFSEIVEGHTPEQLERILNSFGEVFVG